MSNVQTGLRILVSLFFIFLNCHQSLCYSSDFRTIKKDNTPQSALIFTEAAEKAGLKFRHYNGMNGKFYLPEIMGAGASLFDFDNDGDLDVFLVQGNVLEPNQKPNETLFPWREPEPPRSKLFRNDLVADSKGNKILKFTDVTQQSGIVAVGYGMGAAVCDINNDGWADLYIYNLGSNKMYLNNGNGTFKDVTQKTNTDDVRFSTGASFFDYDRDGWFDLIVINYIDFTITKKPKCYSDSSSRDYCGPRAFHPAGNRLFRNKGDGTFEDKTAASGIEKEFGHALGVVTADLNNDGWTDIFIANDSDPNEYWINSKKGSFQNEALISGTSVNRDGKAEAGMGVDVGDFNQDGLDDIFITHLMEETNTLYVNIGEGMFEDQTREAGLGMPGRRLTGFGTFFFDYDNDGWLDLLVANGSVRLLPDLVSKGDPYPLGQANQLFRNDTNGKFVEVADKTPDEFQRDEVSRGAAFGDVDNDGDTDVILTNNNGPVRLFLNQIGNKNHWLGLRLVGERTNSDMLGAKVEIVISPKKVLLRRVRTDGSYLSAHDPRVLVGLGADKKIQSVRVTWTDGKIEEFKINHVDRYIALKKGTSLSKR